MIRYFAPTKLSENIHETPEGFLICYDVLIGRTGEMTYGEGESPIEPGEDGTVLVTRDPSELFNKDTIASFEGKAFTIKHPEEFVDPENWSRLAKGVIQNVRKNKSKDEDGEESLIADILVTDALAIQLVKSGMREVSCGYEAIYEETGPGKGRQTNIIGNHLALVEQGRAGPSYAIMDSKMERSQMSNLKTKMKELFNKAIDEATEGPKVISDEFPEKKDKDKEDKKVGDAGAYDELVKMFKDLDKKIDSMMAPKNKDEGGTLGEAIGYPKDDKEDKEDMPKDADMPKKNKEDTGDEPAVAPELEDRLKAIEAAVAKLMEKMTGEDEMDDPEEMGDEDKKDKEDKDKVGDSKTGLEGSKNPFEIGDSKKEVVTAAKLNELNKAFWEPKIKEK